MVDQRVMADVGQDQQPAVAHLAGQLGGLGDGDERVAIAGHDKRCGVPRRAVARPTIASNRRRQLPGPWAGSCRFARRVAQPGSSRSIRSGSMRTRPTDKRGSRSVAMLIATSVRNRSGKRVA